MLKQYITPEMVEEARRNIQLRFGPLGETVVRRTYSRPRIDGMEDWYDICARVVNGNCNFVKPEFIEPGEPEKLYNLMVTMQILPAGRHLWATGIDRYRQFINNCYVADFTESFSKHFTYTFMRLMEGGGVGANYSNRFIHSNPNHPEGHWIANTRVNLHIICNEGHKDIDFPVPLDGDTVPLRKLLSEKYPSDYDGVMNGNHLRVEDSREGWATALERLLELHFSNRQEADFVVDISLVRPYGAEIKGFGGKASGPTALVLMLMNINRLLNESLGSPLTALQMMEMDHYIAQAVVSGGTRRSARMAMKHWLDDDIFDFIRCKLDYRLHWTTNISVVVDEEFFDALRSKRHKKHTHASQVMDEVIQGMLTNGEPGFINATMCKEGEAPGTEFFSTNPCVTGETLILTEHGMMPATALVSSPEKIAYGGKHYHTEGFFSTGVKAVYELRTEEGSVLKATADHRILVHSEEGEQWKALHELQPGDKVILTGDWSISVEGLEAITRAIGRWVYKKVPLDNGLLGVDLYDRENERCLTEEEAVSIKLAMNMLGVPSAINHNSTSKTWWIRFSRSAYENVVRVIFNRKRGHHTKHRAPSWNETVKHVQFVGEEEVYDCQVPGINRYISNGFVSHNCGEIPMMRYSDLKAFDVCCLGHVNLAFAEDPLECFRLMTRFLIRATFAPLPDELTHRNVQRNRRIGVGFLGFHEWLVNHGIKYSQAPQSGWVKRQLRKFREVVIEAARQYASQLRIPEPIKKTTVAPTGTISNIPGTTSGIQPLYAPFYRRRVRYSNSDLELRRVLDRSEYEAVEPALNEPNTTVVSYVCRDIMVDRTSERIGENRALELIESQFDLQVSDFLKVQAMVQREYADNAVSITINVNPQEVSGQQLKELLMLYLPELKGVTIFPEMSRPQSPLERITREEYEAAAFRVAGNYEEDCASGSCPIN